MAESPPVLRFDDSPGIHVDLERLVASRMLIQGSSGAGKSYLARYILEQTHGKIQQIVIDPDGEFTTLREHFDYVVATADGDGDVPAHPDSADLLCRQLMELEASAILDIYELSPKDRRLFVARFLHRLINLPKEMWRPALVVVDEAHEFAPEAGSAPPSKEPMELIVSKGRKRGLCAVYMTQRLSKLSKNASDLQNILVGYTGLDTDKRRAGDLLGLEKAQRDDLPKLRPGEFFAFGPAISREVIRVRSGEVRSYHPEPGEIVPPTPPPRGALRDLVSHLEGIQDQAREEEETIEALRARIQELEQGRVGVKEAEVERRINDAIQDLEEELDLVKRERDVFRARVSSALPLVEDLGHALTNGTSPKAQHAKEPANSPEPAKKPDKRPRATPTTSGPRAADERILDALATLRSMGVDPVSRANAAVFSQQSPKSSAYAKHVSSLESEGLIHYPAPGMLALTPAGELHAKEPEEWSGIDELHEAWLSYLEPAQCRILRAVVDHHPRALSREELADRSDQSPRSSAYAKHVATMEQLGLLIYPKPGHVAAGETLFPPALTDV